MLSYLDFDLQFQRDGASYRARVLRAPGGEGQHPFQLPFEKHELENFLLKIGQPRRGVRRADSPQTELTKQFGGKLFRALFDGEVRDSFVASQQEAERQGKGLRLRLHTNETPELADLPWEYLYSQSLKQHLALLREIPLVRYLELPLLVPSLLVKGPLRILVIISNPNDVANLNTQDEWDRVNQALHGLQTAGRVVVERLDIPSVEALQRRLQKTQVHVVHFIGHGGFDSSSQDGQLLFEDEYKNRRPVSGGDLGRILGVTIIRIARIRQLKLIFWPRRVVGPTATAKGLQM